MCHGSFICAMPHSYMTHSCHGSFICAMTHLFVPWLIYLCHDSFMLCLCHDSFMLCASSIHDQCIHHTTHVYAPVNHTRPLHRRISGSPQHGVTYIHMLWLIYSYHGSVISDSFIHELFIHHTTHVYAPVNHTKPWHLSSSSSPQHGVTYTHMLWHTHTCYHTTHTFCSSFIRAMAQAYMTHSYMTYQHMTRNDLHT